jgi:glycine hydroxymethyltransferase
MIQESIQSIRQQDPEIADAIEKELRRQQDNIELIASENFISEAVLAAAGSVLTNKYAEGYPGHRYYGGCEYVDIVEEIAIRRACEVFGAKYANVQPHSGSQANFAVYLALCQPGDTVLGMSLDEGGHLTHGSSASFSGKLFNAVSYGCDPKTGRIDYDRLRALAKEHKPRMIIAGASAYPRLIDFAAFGEIAREVGAYLMVDIAHIAGLCAAGLHPNPFPWADVVTSTTHKTMRGPRGGILLSNDPDIAKKLNSAIFPGTQGGPLMHIIAAKAVALGEAQKPEFLDYQRQILKNAAALAEGLRKNGFELVSGGTDNHLMLMDLSRTEVSGRDMQERLDAVRITANKNKIPGDPRSAGETSGLRLGTPASTSRGFKEPEMREVAELITLAFRDLDKNCADIIARVDALCRKYPIYTD